MPKPLAEHDSNLQPTNGAYPSAPRCLASGTNSTPVAEPTHGWPSREHRGDRRLPHRSKRSLVAPGEKAHASVRQKSNRDAKRASDRFLAHLSRRILVPNVRTLAGMTRNVS